MKERKMTLVVTFHTTAAAMAMEKRCREAGIGGRLLPVPRELSSDCGIAWAADPADREAVEEIAKRVETDRIEELLL